MLRGFLAVSFLLALRLSGQAVDTLVDPAGKTYYLLTDATLVVTNPLGENLYAWYDSSLGRPAQVDLSDPFGILAYYPDYGTVVILDRTLSELRRLELFDIDGIEQPGVLARGLNNSIWVFDEWDYRLKQLLANGRIGNQTNNLRLKLGLVDNPTDLRLIGNNLIIEVADREERAVFTNYGKFLRWESF